jgi:hypothetical protein
MRLYGVDDTERGESTSPTPDASFSALLETKGWISV